MWSGRRILDEAQVGNPGGRIASSNPNLTSLTGLARQEIHEPGTARFRIA